MSCHRSIIGRVSHLASFHDQVGHTSTCMSSVGPTKFVQLMHGLSVALQRALIKVDVHMQERLQHRPDDLRRGLQKTLERISRQEMAEQASEQLARQA